MQAYIKNIKSRLARNCLRFAIPPTQVWTLAYLFSVFIVVCYLSLVILNLLFEGAKIQQMLTSVLSDGAKNMENGAVHVACGALRVARGRRATKMLPKGAKWIQKRAQKEPKGPKMEPRGAKREPRGPKWEPNGSRKRAKIEPKINQKAFTLHLGEKVPKHQYYNSKFGPKKR